MTWKDHGDGFKSWLPDDGVRFFGVDRSVSPIRFTRPTRVYSRVERLRMFLAECLRRFTLWVDVS